MSYYYLDTNPVVKYYITEPGSAWVRQLLDAQDLYGRSAHIFFSVTLTITEVSAALGIIYRVGRLSRQQSRLAFQRFMNEKARFQFVPVTEQLLIQAADLSQQHPLRAYDAVQLAAALLVERRLQRVGESLTFVSGDRQLLRAATAEGLSTDNPFDHTDLDP